MIPSPTADRLFIATPLSEDVRRALSEHLTRHLGGRTLPGRVVAPENWHLTLKFLGDTPKDASDRLRRVVAATDLGTTFELAFTSLGAFPNPARARVLWLGTGDGAPDLAALAARVEHAAVSAGFEAEARPFAAHLTLSRLKPEIDVRTVLATVPRFDRRQTVAEVVLFRSHLSREGPRYEALQRFALGSPVART
jgi:RNA 2',3'-cyclic 3'-phosphodiesterase